MDYARQQRDPARHAIGIAFVVLFHILLIWALVNGLGSKAIQLIKKPLNATIIEEIRPPPPPPPPIKRIIEPPKMKVIQPFVPPPDIPVPTPPPPVPVIASVATAPPTEPNVIAPPAPPAPPAPKPAIRQGISCSQMEKPSFPREAIRGGVQKGQVIAVLTINDKGAVSDIQIESSNPPRVFERVVRDTLTSWKCNAEGQPYKARVEINFSLTD
jgi:periplasmic protein TonB